jgi:uncharacterized protein
MLDYQNSKYPIIDIDSMDFSKQLAKVYRMMFLGLMVTAGTSFITMHTLLVNVLANGVALILLMILELGIVVYLSSRITKLTASQATFCFIAYAILNGITLSLIFFAYTSTSIISAFVISALFFGLMAAYGATTKSDLSKWGPLLFIGLISIIVAFLINLFIQSSMITYIVSFIAVAVFLGLTAYDNQRIKNMYYQYEGTSIVENLAVFGALMLYLDFINLFLSVLRIIGRRR